jgi:PPE-repeat protein
MDVVLPPEITSNLIHSGPGAGSLLDAATAWRRLGAGLDQSAAEYRVAVSSIPWEGPSSVAMQLAAQSYLAWMRTTAAQAHQLAAAAQTAASSFSSVRAEVVPLAEVTANRLQLQQLLSTNYLGQNLPAISMVEERYAQMWGQNTAALTTYQSSSTQAMSTLTPFSPAPAAAGPLGGIFDPGSNTATTGLAGLLNLVSGSSGSSFGSLLQSNLVTTAAINSTFSSGFPINLLSYFAQTATASNVSNLPSSISGEIGQGLSEGLSGLPTLGPNIPAMSSSAVASTGPVTALMGKAVPMGSLSAPPTAVRLLGQETPVGVGDEIAAPFMPMMMPPMGARKPPESPDSKKKVEWKGPEIPGVVVARPPSAG